MDVDDLNPWQRAALEQARYDARWFGGLDEDGALAAALRFVLEGEMVPGVRVD